MVYLSGTHVNRRRRLGAPVAMLELTMLSTKGSNLVLACKGLGNVDGQSAFAILTPHRDAGPLQTEPLLHGLCGLAALNHVASHRIQHQVHHDFLPVTLHPGLTSLHGLAFVRDVDLQLDILSLVAGQLHAQLPTRPASQRHDGFGSSFAHDVAAVGVEARRLAYNLVFVGGDPGTGEHVAVGAGRAKAAPVVP